MKFYFYNNYYQTVSVDISFSPLGNNKNTRVLAALVVEAEAERSVRARHCPKHLASVKSPVPHNDSVR